MPVRQEDEDQSNLNHQRERITLQILPWDLPERQEDEDQSNLNHQRERIMLQILPWDLPGRQKDEDYQLTLAHMTLTAAVTE